MKDTKTEKKQQIYTPYMIKDWIIKYDHDNISKIK